MQKSSDDLRCFCPNEEYISKRNIILVDVTDKLPRGKIEHLEQLIYSTAFVEQGFWEWILGGFKVEKTTVYTLSDQDPQDMRPLKSYCSLPNSIALTVTDGLDSPENTKKIIDQDVKSIVKEIASKDAAGSSRIIESLTTITSNPSYWKAGSTLILFSDLYENSEICSRFESGVISPFEFMPSECKTRIEILGRNLKNPKTDPSAMQSSVLIYRILSKEKQEGLQEFWESLFDSIGHKVLFK